MGGEVRFPTYTFFRTGEDRGLHVTWGVPQCAHGTNYVTGK
ncbi:hypothetical protein FB556_0018 [Enteractinococcus coprophilus]|uniref:Uncharacterized protein n=1 Tax=Enteractinococcus coprophilus TaxID=1027633 RepID=A0A543ALX2_9MICC|nr:hypothetical protein FB556_0018 [Enteractinococcus coprophilus]